MLKSNVMFTFTTGALDEKIMVSFGPNRVYRIVDERKPTAPPVVWYEVSDRGIRTSRKFGTLEDALDSLNDVVQD